jgi:peroxiredoxin
MKSVLFSLTFILVATYLPSNACAESLRSQAQALTDRASAALSNEDYESSAKDYEKALAKWKILLKQAPGDSDVQDKISLCANNFRYSLGRPSYEAILKGDAHSEKKEFEKAAKCFKAAIEGYQKAHRRLGQQKFAQNLHYAEVNYAKTNFAHVVATGGKAPQFDLESLRKGRVQLSDYRGKTVLLVHWAAWCGYCQRELPALQELYDRYRHKGLVVVGLSADRVNGWDRGTVAGATKMADKVTYPLAWATDKSFADYGSPSGVPTMIWIDPQGRLVKIVEERKVENLERDFAAIQSTAAQEKQLSQKQTETPYRSQVETDSRQPGNIADSAEADQQQGRTYTIDEIGLSLTLPARGWKRRQKVNMKNVEFLALRKVPVSSNSVKFTPNLLVAVEQFASPIDAGRYATLAIPLLEKNNWTVVSQKQAHWNNEKGVDIRAKRGDTSLFQRYVIGHDGNVIILCVTAHRQQVDAIEDEIRSIFDSCRITSK